MSANAGTPPPSASLSGDRSTVANIERRNAAPDSPRLSAGKPWRTSERGNRSPPSEAATISRNRRFGNCRQAVRRSTVRRAATIGKPSGFRSKAATVRPCAACQRFRQPCAATIERGQAVATVRPWRTSNAAGTPRNRSTVPEASASPAQVASRPRRIPATIERRAAVRFR